MRLIDAEWLEDLLLMHEQNARAIEASGRKVSFTYADGIRTGYADVGLCPTIEAEPIKHGRWIKERVHNLHNGEKRNARECSECGAIYFVYDMANAIDEVPRYCPNCGARCDL